MYLLKTYLTVALRQLRANKLVSVINLLGLATALTCLIVIILFVSNETNYDQHWEKADRTYRVMRSFSTPDGSGDIDLSTNAPQLGPLLKQDFPQFENVIRILNSTPVVSKSGSSDTNYESDFYYVDSDIHEVFNIPMLHGRWEDALLAPYQIVLNESLSTKYFGDTNPVGETLFLGANTPYIIRGVMENLKQNSHFSPNAFVSISTLEARFGSAYMNNWGGNSFHTYVVTEESYAIEQFIDEIPSFIQRHIPTIANVSTSFPVLAVTDIHLNSHRENEFSRNGSKSTVVTFSAIAVIILALACFNFMNLTTARSIARGEEIGMRKVFGATRNQLVAQYLGEAVLLTLLAALLAGVITPFLLPWINNLLDLDLKLDFIGSPVNLVKLFILALGVGLLAGVYPAFHMTDVPLAKLLSGNQDSENKGGTFRKLLVVLQFIASIVLMVASGITFNQIRYTLDLDLGLNIQQVLIYRGLSSESLSQYEAMKTELLRHPEILFVTAANLMPSDQNTNSQLVRVSGAGNQSVIIAPLTVDYDFFETFDIRFLNGRSFSRANSSDRYIEPSQTNPHTTGAFILNQAAVRLLGWTPQNAVGRSIENLLTLDGSSYVQGPVVGVTENTLFSSSREEVKPMFYRLENGNSDSFPRINQMAIKFTGNRQQESIAYSQEIWQRFLPGTPIDQSFLEQNYAELYRAEQRQGIMFTLFSTIAVSIALMGMFGLASYLTERRTKEIGIRKVLGSTVLGIVSLVSKDFVKLVLIANIIACPVAWYLMNLWLQGFVYRVELGSEVFIGAAMITLSLSIITVGSLATSTACKNPILALRHE